MSDQPIRPIRQIRKLATLLLSQGVAAVAQTPSTNTPAISGGGASASNQLPEVVVTGQTGSYKSDAVALPKLSQPLRDTPQSVSVVPREVMNDQNATTLRDVLRNVAGISIAAGEGSSQGDNLTLRGFTARNDIFLDGMRDYGSYYRDPFNYQEVDVLEGPESVMFGRGSTGGIVNQESKTPMSNPFATGTLSLGTDLTRRGTADLNEPVPELGKDSALRLNMMGNDSQMAGRDVGENRRFAFAPSLTLSWDPSTRLTFSYYHQSEDDTPDYGLPWYLSSPASVPRHEYYGFKDDYLKTGVDIGTIKLEHDFNDSISIRDQVRFANYTRNFRITEPKLTVAPSPTAMVTRNELGGHSEETFLWDQLDLTSRFKTAFLDHTLVTGMEGGQETSDPTRYTYAGVPGASLYSPNEDQNFSDTATTYKSRVHARAYSYGIYALDTIKLGESWELSGGIRGDYFDARYHESVAGVAFNQEVIKPSYRGALVYKPVEKGSIYFDYGTSWNPSAETLSLTTATANTPPEANQTFEFGTKWDLLHDRLSVRGSLFRTEKTNAREPDPDDPTVDVLSGDERVDGIELAASGHITKDWQALVSYDYLDSELVSSKFYPRSVGLPLQNVPKNNLSLWTTYDLPWKLELGAGMDYKGSRTANSTTLTSTSVEESVGSYWTLNAMIKYKASKHVAFQANLYNLTDKYYYDQLHPGHVIPGAGISALFSATVTF